MAKHPAIIGQPTIPDSLASGYAAMAQDRAREREATEWAEALLQDVSIEIES